MEHLKIGKYYGDDINKKTYLISEYLEEGYRDITSIEMIVMASDFTNKDFLFTRDFLISYTSGLDISNITTKEKHLLAQYTVLPYQDIVEFYDAEKADVLTNDVDNILIGDLKKRKENILSIYENTLSKDDFDDLYISLSTDNIESFDLDSVLLKIDSLSYLNEGDKSSTKNILRGETQKGYSDDIYKIN
jgi:hypothetical protein